MYMPAEITDNIGIGWNYKHNKHKICHKYGVMISNCCNIPLILYEQLLKKFPPSFIMSPASVKIAVFSALLCLRDVIMA